MRHHSTATKTNAMLPEFPTAQEAIQDAWNKAFFKALGFSDPLLSGIQVRVQTEGNRAIVGASEIEFQKASVLYQAKPEVGTGIPFDEFFALARRLGANMAQQQAKHIFKVMSQPGPQNAVLESADGVFAFEDFMSALEGMEIDFDASGAPQWPTFYLAPSAAARMEEQREAWNRNDECRKRLADLVTRKRKEFDERETRRRLVY